MKKWLIGSIIAVLIGTCPVSAYAANDNLNTAIKLVGNYAQQNKQGKDSDQNSREKERKEKERREKERKDQDRRDQDRRDQERRDQERRDQDRRDQEHRDQEHRDQGRREQERRDQERREQEQREQKRREQERRDQELRERERREQERREQIRRQYERWEWEHRDHTRLKWEHDDARYIIHRTAPVILIAQRSVQYKHYYSGLAVVIAHQQRAYQLYQVRFYRRAIYHSMRARRLAMIIILGNGQKWFGLPTIRDEREEHYVGISPRDNELDFRLDMNNIGKDDEAVHIMFNLDIN